MYVRVGLCQINAILGDVEGNCHKVLSFLERAQIAGARIVCFPELALTGYPPDDLVTRYDFVRAQKEILLRIAREAKDCIVLVGYIELRDDRLYNSAAVIFNGNVLSYEKIGLGGMGFFDERVYFGRGRRVPIFVTRDGFRFGIALGEELFGRSDVLFDLRSAGNLNAIFNLSASPYYIGRPRMREESIRTIARELSVWIAFCNMVGGQDEVVFDGTSSVISPRGETVARAPSFKEHILIADILAPVGRFRRYHEVHEGTKEWEDIRMDFDAFSASYVPKSHDSQERSISRFLEEEEEIFSAITLGTRDYAFKNGFSKVLVTLSGGIDSSLVACIAAEAVGSKNVTGISMPSRFSSEHSREDARILAKNLGIEFHTIPIDSIYDLFLRELDFLFAGTKFSSAEENLQARIRGMLAMTISNKFSYLVLVCGNRSEASVGYATLYGDLAGGFAPIRDLFKSDVYRIARYYNRMKGAEVIPARVFEKPPSAELRPGQRDEDDLLPYHILDQILKLYLDERLAPSVISRLVKLDLPTVLRVVRMVELSEYKRRQSPIGLRIVPSYFQIGERMAVTKRIEFIQKCF